MLGIYHFNSGKPKIKTQAVEKTETGGEIEESVQTYEDVEARVYDNTTRTIYNTTIPGKVVARIREQDGNLGRKWLKDGKEAYALNKVGSNEYKVVRVPITMDQPPSKLHRALQQQEIEICYNVQPVEGMFQKLLPILIWSGAIIFIMFLMVSNKQ